MKVSVVIPTYNGGATLERAIMSVINQTAKCEIEILLCDDVSDNMGYLIKMKDIYPNVRIIQNGTHTGGPNEGRNKGMLYATGDVIAFLDQDDEWMPNKLKIQLKEIEHGAEFVYSGNITQKV